MSSHFQDLRAIWAYRIFISLVIIFSLGRLVASVEASSGLATDWIASARWIDSANCARLTGILLIGCSDGEIIPYADLSNADDVGHALLLGIIAQLLQRDLVLDHAGILNVLINFIGIYLVSLCLYCANLRYSSLIFLISGSVVAGSFVGVAPHVALPGVTCLGLLFPLSLLLFNEERPAAFGFWLIVGAGALGLAVLLRQSVGMMGSVASLLSFLILFFTSRFWAKRTVFAIFVVLLLSVSSYATTAVLAARDTIWNVPESSLIDRHGIQHNLFIGLGVVPNSFGVEWNDGYGFEVARRVDPTVGYVSFEYYEILGEEYFRLLFEDPLEVVRIYSLKAKIFLESSVPSAFFLRVPIGVSFLFSILVYFLVRRKSSGLQRQDHVVVVAVVFFLMYLAQGILIHPSTQYSSPVELLILLILASSIEWPLRGERVS